MTATEYKYERIKCGSKSQAAKLLGVAISTVSRRERGEIPVTKEAWLALLSLPKVLDPDD